MKKYIFIAIIASCTAFALIARADDRPKEAIESTKVPERPTTTIEIYIQPPVTQRFLPGKVPDSICHYDKDAKEPIEEIIDMCIASKQNWLRF